MENGMKFPQKIKVEISRLHAKSLQSLCDPMDCSIPGFSVHWILQARILSGLLCLPPRDLPDPGIEPESPALQADSLPSEPPEPHWKGR